MSLLLAFQGAGPVVTDTPLRMLLGVGLSMLLAVVEL